MGTFLSNRLLEKLLLIELRPLSLPSLLVDIVDEFRLKLFDITAELSETNEESLDEPKSLSFAELLAKAD